MMAGIDQGDPAHINNDYSDINSNSLAPDKTVLISSSENDWIISSLEKQLKHLELDKSKDKTDKKFNDLYLDFPFLINNDTIDWIRLNLVMFIMRGLPGSGKSTIIRKLTRVMDDCKDGSSKVTVCSADQYFIKNDGSYKFDVTKLKEAHLFCQNKAKNSINARTRTIVIDNTNIMRWEMQPYLQMANQGGYIVIIVEPKTPWRLNAEILSEKNCHNVPKDILVQKVTAYSSFLPAYFGWFLGKNETRKLRYGGKKLLKLCVEKCDKFRTDFKELTSNMSNPQYTDYSSPYDFEYSRKSNLNKSFENSLLHCTSKYCGHARNGRHTDDVMSYASRKEVKDSFGLVSKLKITGFVITEKTFGARVKLTNNQLSLFDQPSSEEGRRAHITLAITGNTSPVQAGLDLLKLVELEITSNRKQFTEDVYTYRIPTTNYVMKRFREGLWFVDTSSKDLIFDALFSGYYT